MANSGAQILTIDQEYVKVDVRFYSKREQKSLSAYSTADSMAAIVRTGIEIPTAEFLTYYLFKRKRLGKAGWTSYKELGRRIGTAINDLNEWVDFNGVSISTPKDVVSQDDSITERIGESIGMSVVNRIHGLTEADWNTVPERPGRTGCPTFDYNTAADNSSVIQVETKGSSIADNSFKPSTVSNHRKSIRDKKTEIAKKETAASYEFPADLRYGTISVVGTDSATPVRCYLVDPPADENNAVARRLRLLFRIAFLAEIIAFLSPRSQLAAALQSRLAAICRLREPFQLDKVALRGVSGDRIRFRILSSGHLSFFTTRSRITDSQDGGVVFPLEAGKRLFFLGIRSELLELAITQDFNAILNYTAIASSVEKSIDCVFTRSTLDDVALPSRVAEVVAESGIYRTVRLRGQMFYSSAGLIMGVLPIDEATSETDAA